jgi:LacI family transcriptional regulator
VSRVLSRPEMISEATRTRVLAAADRLGYVANGAARALAMRKTHTVGALVPRFGGSSFPTLVQALEKRAGRRGLQPAAVGARRTRGRRTRRCIRALLGRGVDAVALLGADQPAAVFDLLRGAPLPYVLMWAQDSEQGPCIGFADEDPRNGPKVACSSPKARWRWPTARCCWWRSPAARSAG